ncbi:Rqc2 family fibronectin-binding protein [Fuchsiella alkaliacetigena]|uniref:Rqc2 family fibronectin-binding protein n=1 Tax=Fuchsiella alkaliacetigena TaxID=957042 RepID=UPI00200A02D4|nr:NFACT RNA binding domain-containing protein [Fuchsiella alkaliacetigena]MCK8826081.1 NFACT family protein [Fuchsiella alkaliacetigena]
MALDGLVLKSIKDELTATLIKGRLDKIYQPKDNLLTLRFRLPGENIELLLSAQAQSPRVHITEEDRKNPLRPPAFCMLLRKHLKHGRLRKIEQPDFERILKFYIDSKNEAGTIETKILIIEVMGRHSNIILTTEDGKILDSIKRVTSDMSRHREILPNLQYKAPPAQDKVNPRKVKKKRFLELIQADIERPIFRALLENLRGISPLIAKEIAYRAGINRKDKLRKIDSLSLNRLWEEFQKLITTIENKDYQPTLIVNTDGSFEAYSTVDLTQFPQAEKKCFDSTNQLLDYYFTNVLKRSRISNLTASLNRTVENSLNKAQKRYRRFKGQLKGARNAEKHKIKGELIKANLHQMKPGQDKLKATNYYSEAQEEMIIQLDPELSPIENAQKYFKKYEKAKKSVDYLENEFRKAKNEISYLKQVAVHIEQAEEIADLEAIKTELSEEGYIKTKQKQKSKSKQKNKKSKPLKFKSNDNYDIRVGRNNRQNDYLLKRVASNDDIWLHVKDLAGSHVIILNHTGGEVPQQTIEEAAHLAAYYSKGRKSSNVPVDYTLAKNVNKPKGAKPGLVYYEKQQTLYVTPAVEVIKELKNSQP